MALWDLNFPNLMLCRRVAGSHNRCMFFALISVYAHNPWRIEELFFKPYQELRYYDEVRYAGGTWRAEAIRDFREYGIPGEFTQLKFNGNKIHNNLELEGDGNVSSIPHDAGFIQAPDGKKYFVQRVHSGMGHGEWTTFYSLNAHGKIKEIHQERIEGNGPIFRDFDDDGKLEWVFDDDDYYTYYGDVPKWLLVYKPEKSGKLKLWKKIPNKHKVRIDRLVVPEWTATGQQKFKFK